MKKNKGFTLVELLGVITLLAILTAIIVPAIESTIRRGRENAHQRQVEAIDSALRSWVRDNSGNIPNTADGELTISLSLGQLKSMGYIDYDFRNPLNNNVCFSNASEFRIVINRNQREYVIYNLEDAPVNNDTDCNSNIPIILFEHDGSDTTIFEIVQGTNAPLMDGVRAFNEAGSSTTVTRDPASTAALTPGNHRISYRTTGTNQAIAFRTVIVTPRASPPPTFTGITPLNFAVGSAACFNFVNNPLTVPTVIRATAVSPKTIAGTPPATGAPDLRIRIAGVENVLCGIENEYFVVYSITDSAGIVGTASRRICVGSC